jgi:hypothetical protein
LIPSLRQYGFKPVVLEIETSSPFGFLSSF